MAPLTSQGRQMLYSCGYYSTFAFLILCVTSNSMVAIGFFMIDRSISFHCVVVDIF